MGSSVVSSPLLKEPLTSGDHQVEISLRAGLSAAEQTWVDGVMARHHPSQREAEARGERPTEAML